MPSQSYQLWLADRCPTLDEIESAHASVGGTGPGRRFATQQINQAYAVLLSAQFQAFCRDLHSEAAGCWVDATSPVACQSILRTELLSNRKLDRGNPNPGNIGSDFNRFGIAFWNEVLALDVRNAGRRDQLELLNRWRNAIAHQDFDAVAPGGAVTLLLSQVRAWRSICHELARYFDEATRAIIERKLGSSPW